MLQWLKRRAKTRATAGELYGVVVAAARSPRNYSQFRVPDTPEGRFEMVALSLFLVLERVKRIQPDGMALAQGVIEAFVVDMDDCLREMGVGDLTVPKKVKRAAAAFYERAGHYRGALNGDAAGLAPVLAEAIYQGRDAAAAAGLAGEAGRQFKALDAASDETVLEQRFPSVVARCFLKSHRRTSP